MPLERINHVYRSLRFRLTLWNAAVMLLTAVTALVALRESVRLALLRETDQRLLEDAGELELAVKELYPALEQIREELDRKAEGHKAHGMFVRLMGPSRNEIWSTAAAQDDPLPEIPLSENLALTTMGDYRVTRQSVEVADGTVFDIFLGTSLKSVDNDVFGLTRIMIMVGGVILLLAPVGGYWLAGRATRPLAAIHRTAEVLRPDRFDERLPIRGTGDELDRLSATINGLLDRIAAYIDRHRQFLANAAHELRSPLAAVQSSVEVALHSGRSPSEYEELLGEIVEECSSLRSLINQLLTLAEVDVAPSQRTCETVRLDQVAARSIEMFAGVAEERQIELRWVRLDAAPVAGEAVHFRQVVNNLLDNALKFNRAGGWVEVEVTAAEGEAVLRVSNSGPGIDEEDVPHLFERFFRGDKSRAREGRVHGSGLGLSICQAIVTRYGGSIQFDGQRADATTFLVALPMLAAHASQATPGPQSRSLG